MSDLAANAAASPSSSDAPATAAPPVKPEPTLTHVATQWAYTSPLVSCRFDPTGRFVFAGAQDSKVARFQLADGKITALAGHESWVRAIGFLAGGETLVTGGFDGRLIWWPTAAEQPQPLRTVEAHAGWLRALAVSPDGATIATGGNDLLVKLWNASDGTFVREFSGHDRHVYSVHFHPSGEFLLSGDLHGAVHQWETATGKLVRSFDSKDLYAANEGQGAEYGGVRSMAFGPKAEQLACGGLHKASNPFGAVQDPLVLVFDWQSQQKTQSHTGASDLKGIIWRVVYHADGFLIGGSGGSGGGIVLFWKADQPNEFHRFGLPNTLLDLDLHADGLQLATAHHDKHLRISRMAAKPT